ncbi:MAG: LysM peptidoglycan-binding domain-containing protein [Anaerolineae bacterium]|nr:LysM peptidoglycan-binding domain-containing protein [Anaerolineae bacterium]
MASKTSFSAEEWSLIKDSPDWVNAALAAADNQVALTTKIKESQAFKKAVAGYESDSQLIREVIADKGKPAKELNGATLSDAVEALEKVAKILDTKVDRREGEKFRAFLIELGQSVAESAGEGMLGLGEKVSKKEAAALQKIKAALKATDADKKARADAEAKAAAAARAKADAAAAAEKAKADAEAKAKAKAKAEAAVKAKREAMVKAKAEAAAAAKAKADAAAAKAKAEREAEIKAEFEAKVARKKEEAMAKAEAAAAAAKAAKYITEHTVVPGESLSLLSKKYYNSIAKDKWMLIYEANKDIIGDDPNLIRVGQVLKIPTLPS